MNELIKITTNENQEKEIREKLLLCNDFVSLFNTTCDLKDGLNTSGLKALLSVLNEPYFSVNYGVRTIINLRDVVLMEKVIFRQPNNYGRNEKEMQKEIVRNFKKLFPNFKYKGQEIKVDGIGRVDILAEEKGSGRPVLIEIKRGKENPNKQLIAYAKEYKNPILIGITEMTSGFLKEIEYYSYQDGRMKGGRYERLSKN